MTQTWYGPPQPFDWQAWFERFRQLEQQLQQAVSQIEDMTREIAELKSKPPVHVEYHFDQLKVSRLEGTLNIGLSPQGLQNMEPFDVSGAGNWSPPYAPVPGTVPGTAPGAVSGDAGSAPGAATGPAAVPPPSDATAQRIRGLQAEAASEVERTIPSALHELADQLQVPINEPHLRAIIDDIKKQLNHRVHYYARTTPYPEQGTDEERTNWSRSVLGRTKRDVEAAIAQYLRSLVQSQSEGEREKP
ncbi:spore germination protein GerPC [Cohnella lubricantis]|uniref:Uncharacterized protein n=1 Tax=Cohnella lubricantis TaxID=2163172 RepID=A0A841T8U4_9BACL|nr:spore germination protein GerPC [Cohnella lubricantis]MBB6676435.1 hypothetical protein [Cohnella lubricantis]MBP2117558.1 spore germination protein PC [Cohnella lubricantis]